MKGDLGWKLKKKGNETIYLIYHPLNGTTCWEDRRLDETLNYLVAVHFIKSNNNKLFY